MLLLSVRCPPYPSIAKFGPVLLNLLEPEIFHVSEAVPVDDTEADQEDVCSVIGQNPDLVKVLLSSCVPQTAY